MSLENCGHGRLRCMGSFGSFQSSRSVLRMRAARTVVQAQGAT